MKSLLIGATALLLAVGSIEGTSASTIYTSDPNLADFTAGISDYATFLNNISGDAPSPIYTPTTASLSTGSRVFNWAVQAIPGLAPGQQWVEVVFSDPEASIRVFPNIDHYGDSYDGYQYTIWGSNDGSNWTKLFDALSVSNGAEPFTLGAFFGTAPSRVNNVLTPGAGPGGTVGYIADFNFSNPYSYYAFGTSALAYQGGNTEQEFSAIAAVPEPTVWAMLLVGFFGVGGMMRRPRSRLVLAQA